MIPTVTVLPYNYPGYHINLDNTTEDKVFLLSVPEANKYFSSDEARQCGSTRYANRADNYKGGNSWWLRLPDGWQQYAAFVRAAGGVDLQGYSVEETCGVRPALWITLDSGDSDKTPLEQPGRSRSFLDKILNRRQK